MTGTVEYAISELGGIPGLTILLALVAWPIEHTPE